MRKVGDIILKDYSSSIIDIIEKFVENHDPSLGKDHLSKLVFELENDIVNILFALSTEVRQNPKSFINFIDR